ncbi:MAG: hypothetical protein ACLSV7_03775 [Oscillospiraceae bacterium]|nr:MAG TPA: hypothetical protein [Caudoviricetes sp.]
MQIKEMQNGRHLRAKWCSIQRRGSCAKAWRDFDAFYRWAMAHGYQDDRWIKRIDPSKPWGPHNCKVIQVSTVTEDDGFAEQWDDTVADFLRRLAWAEANDPAAIARLLRNGVAAAKKAAPEAATSGSGKGNNHKPIIAAEGA